MQAIKTIAATAALLASFSSFAASDLARQLHHSDGYSPADIAAVSASKDGGSVDAEFIRQLSRTDGNADYGYAPSAAASAAKVKPSVGFDAELLKNLTRTDGAGA